MGHRQDIPVTPASITTPVDLIRWLLQAAIEQEPARLPNRSPPSRTPSSIVCWGTGMYRT
jgi:hypothetical protein